MDNQDKQRKIALWKLEHGFAESEGLNSMTREQIIRILEPQMNKLRQGLLTDYLETFGEIYSGDILDDIVMDLKTRKELETLAGQI